MTITQPTSIASDDYEDEPVAALRKQLGLRPIAYLDNGKKGTHPDQRSCPSWCWIGKQEGTTHEHEVDPHTPMEAYHHMEDIPSIVASQYMSPRWKRSAADDYVATATLEPRLEQLGQAAPLIKVALRAEGAGPDDEGCRIGFESERLALSLTDAEELIAVLQYLVQQAEASA